MKLAFDEYGAGPLTVITHGLFGSRANWRSLARRLASECRVVLPDLRNHGDSPHSDAHDYPSMARDILELLDARGVGDTLLLGHSMGGKAAMQVAVTWPERLSKLIIVDVAPRVYQRTAARDVLDALLAVDLNLTATRQDVDDRLAARGLDRDLRRFLLMGLTRTSGGRLRWKFNLPVIASHWPQVGAAISDGHFEGPTLFIRGERSDYLRANDEPAVKKHFPNARLVTIRGAGHWPHVDAPSETFRVIREFMSG